MPDAQQSPLLDLNSLMPDPTQVAGAVQDQWRQKLVQAGNNPIMRNMILQQMYGQNLAGGDPRVLEASQQRQAMQGILQQVNDAAPDNEDPLDYQDRLSHAVLTGMSTVNPAIAMAAAQNLVRVQQARQQRSLLSADTSLAQSRASLAGSQADIAAQQAKIAGLTGGTLIFAKQGQPDGNGLPTAPEAVGSVNANDPDAAQQIAGLQSDAQKGGYTLVPMTPDQFMNGRNQVALTRGQFALQAAQLRAQAMMQAALLRSQAAGQTMNGRSAQMAFRVLSGAEMAAAGVQNVGNMEFGATSPSLGNGFRGSTGESLLEGSRDTMRNHLTSEEQQMYTSFSQPIWRGISAIEAQGGLQGGQQLAGQVREGLEIHPGDTPLTIMGKLAQARQDIETGTKVQLANPALPPVIRQQVQDAITRLIGAIPFTVQDVQQFKAAQEKNPKLTYREFAAENQIGNTATTPEPSPPTASGGTPAAAGQYATAADVRAAYKAGKLPKAQALQLLQTRFGMK